MIYYEAARVHIAEMLASTLGWELFEGPDGEFCLWNYGTPSFQRFYGQIDVYYNRIESFLSWGDLDKTTSTAPLNKANAEHLVEIIEKMVLNPEYSL